MSCIFETFSIIDFTSEAMKFSTPPPPHQLQRTKKRGMVKKLTMSVRRLRHNLSVEGKNRRGFLEDDVALTEQPPIVTSRDTDEVFTSVLLIVHST